MRAQAIVKLSTVALTIGAMFGAAALTEGPTGSAARAAVQETAKTEAPKGNPRRICRTVTPTNTRLTRRVCRTQEDWDAGMDRTQDGLLQFQIKNQTTYQQDGGPL